jgi:hypothetical protein
MDELFFLPPAPVAMPRAYWLDNILSSQLIVIQPSKTEFERILYAFEHRNTTDFDMEIMRVPQQGASQVLGVKYRSMGHTFNTARGQVSSFLRLAIP